MKKVLIALIIPAMVIAFSSAKAFAHGQKQKCAVVKVDGKSVVVCSPGRP